jgi:drug/metabolite transporter (DMT)-like permease
LGNILKAHVALFVVNAIYAANYTVAKEVMPTYMEPFGFILLRVSFAALLFLSIPKPPIIQGKSVSVRLIPRKDWLRFMACGFFGIACNQLLFFKGLNWTTPIHASLIMTATPILVLVMSAIILRERITKQKMLGIAMGLTGAIWIILSKGNVSASAEGVFGDLLVFLNASSYAIYLVLVKPLLIKYNPWMVIKLVFCFGFLFVFPVGIGEFSETNWAAIPLNIWLAIAFVLIFVTFLTYLLNTFALSVVQPSVVSIYIYLQPLLASFIAIAALRDQFEWIQPASAILIFAGVYLVSRPRRQIL